MSSNIKIGVAGDAGAAKAAVSSMTGAINDLAKSVAAANRVPFKAPGIEEASRDLAKLQAQFAQTLAASRTLQNALQQSGQNGQRGIANVNWGAIPQSIRDQAFGLSARGTAWQTNFPMPATPAGGSGGSGGNGIGGGGASGSSNNSRPSLGERTAALGARTAGAFAGGIGGPIGQVTSEAISGAGVGAAEGGGLFGGSLGLLKGAGIGLMLAGLAKAGQMAAQGYDMAKDRDVDADSLKRQMGDLGISFQALTAMSEAASEAMGVNAAQFVRLEQQMEASAHGAYRNAESLGGGTRDAVGFARAYGVDPSQSVSFFGSMKNLDPKQNNRELAVMIADAIARGGGRALAPDVMAAVQSLSSASARLSLSSPNSGAFSASYASLLARNGVGMTPDNALGILSTANNSVSRMGSAGEAGMNFILSALNREGGATLNPVEAQALAEGGLFGTRKSVFSGQAMQRYFGADKLSALTSGPGANVRTVDAIMEQLHNSYGGNKWMELDAAKNLFGFQSYSATAAFMTMGSGQRSGLLDLLSKAGVDPTKVNTSGLATLGQISGAGSMKDLRGIFSELSARTGDGALTFDERDRLGKLSSGNDTQAFRVALAQVMASKNQEDTTGSDIRKGNASLENIQIAVGEKLVPAMNDARDALLSIAGTGGKSATPEDLHQRALLAESANAQTQISGDRKFALTPYDEQLAKLQEQRRMIGPVAGDNSQSPILLRAAGSLFENTDPSAVRNAHALDSQIAAIQAQRATIASGFDTKLNAEQGDKASRLAYLSQLERDNSLPPGLLSGIWMEESSQGIPSQLKRNAAGAEGNFGQLDDTVARYGVRRGSFTSEAAGAAAQMRHLIDVEHGNLKKALFDYNGVKHNIAAGDKYYGDVMKSIDASGGLLDDPSITDTSVAPATGNASRDPQFLDPQIIDTKTPTDHRGSPAAAGGAGTDSNLNVNISLNSQISAPGGTTSKSVATSISMPRASGRDQSVTLLG